MNIHLISIGGAVMHNLALALQQQGHTVSGSDDEIFEPARSRLADKGLLPASEGWFEENIHPELDAVILGMHAKKDNPELLKAISLGLKVYSFPEYVYEHSVNKTRVVIGGSHGKTTTTAMIMHVLRNLGIDFDYLVGSKLEGFDTMVRLTPEARYIIIEGDEYLTSPLDLRPKFHLYFPHIAQLTGIAWDHINVFPTFENYCRQFEIFIEQMPDKAPLVYFGEDQVLQQLTSGKAQRLKLLPYYTPEHKVVDGKTFVMHDGKEYPLQVFGRHNLQNMNGAMLVCRELGISAHDFLSAMGSFGGTARRLEVVKQTPTSIIYRDFAHSPSKLKASLEAVKQQFPERRLVACFELHTYSSLNKDFLAEYAGTMDPADEKIVYFNPHAIAIKKIEPITKEQVRKSFGQGVTVYDDISGLREQLRRSSWDNTNLLMMSSGNFDNLDLNAVLH
jgi:UDP-N-acetylmuramate: L-alanyl-gamma-D-glutamyl-meso-diaminopimelate ligase